MAPLRTCYVRPLKMIVERNRMVWRGKDNTAGDKILRRSAEKILGSRNPFRDCHVSCSLNELAELRVGYVCFIHVEPVHVYSMDRAGIRRSLHNDVIDIRRIVRSHGEFFFRNPHYAVRREYMCGYVNLDLLLDS